MTHLEYVTALTEQLKELDGKTVRATRETQQHQQLPQDFDQQVERALERTIRKRAPL